MEILAILRVAFAAAVGWMTVPAAVPLTFAAGIVLGYAATAPVPCTLTFKVQMPGTSPACAGIVPPLKEITRVSAVVVNVPPHWGLEELIIVKPAGSVSVKVAAVKGRVDIFVKVIAKFEKPFGPTMVG